MNFQSIVLLLKNSVTITRVLNTVNILFVGTAVWIGGDLTASLIEHQYLQVPRTESRYIPPQETVQDIPRRFSEFQDIIRYNVFDVEVRKEVVQEVVVQENTVSPGDVLKGILDDLELLGINYRKGVYIYCILKSKKRNKEDIFTIRDEIFDTGAIVKRIYTTFGNQRVYVQLGDEVGVVRYMPEEEDQNAPASPAPRRQVRQPDPEPAVEPSQSPYTTDGRNFYIASEEVDSHLNNFGALLNQARMVPYFKNGKHQGFRVKAIDKGSLYEKLGLQNNDVIKAVNGESLAEAGGEKLMGLFKLLRNEREFTVAIERDGNEQVLSYYVN